jgi:two-component system cell cycle response regulator CpdR
MAKAILLIEDDEHALALMTAALRREGHTVYAAKDSNEARLLWGEPGRAFDLLIADVKLQGDEDGFSLAETLLEEKPGVPVMFISGDRDCFASPSIRSFGDAPFISKPFNVKQMLTAVDKVLAKGGAG